MGGEDLLELLTSRKITHADLDILLEQKGVKPPKKRANKREKAEVLIRAGITRREVEQYLKQKEETRPKRPARGTAAALSRIEEMFTEILRRLDALSASARQPSPATTYSFYQFLVELERAYKSVAPDGGMAPIPEVRSRLNLPREVFDRFLIDASLVLPSKVKLFLRNPVDSIPESECVVVGGKPYARLVVS